MQTSFLCGGTPPLPAWLSGTHVGVPVALCQLLRCVNPTPANAVDEVYVVSDSEDSKSPDLCPASSHPSSPLCATVVFAHDPHTLINTLLPLDSEADLRAAATVTDHRASHSFIGPRSDAARLSTARHLDAQRRPPPPPPKALLRSFIVAVRWPSVGPSSSPSSIAQSSLSAPPSKRNAPPSTTSPSAPPLTQAAFTATVCPLTPVWPLLLVLKAAAPMVACRVDAETLLRTLTEPLKGAPPPLVVVYGPTLYGILVGPHVHHSLPLSFPDHTTLKACIASWPGRAPRASLRGLRGEVSSTSEAAAGWVACTRSAQAIRALRTVVRSGGGYSVDVDTTDNCEPDCRLSGSVRIAQHVRCDYCASYIRWCEGGTKQLVCVCGCSTLHCVSCTRYSPSPSSARYTCGVGDQLVRLFQPLCMDLALVQRVICALPSTTPHASAVRMDGGDMSREHGGGGSSGPYKSLKATGAAVNGGRCCFSLPSVTRRSMCRGRVAGMGATPGGVLWWRQRPFPCVERSQSTGAPRGEGSAGTLVERPSLSSFYERMYSASVQLMGEGCCCSSSNHEDARTGGAIGATLRRAARILVRMLGPCGASAAVAKQCSDVAVDSARSGCSCRHAVRAALCMSLTAQCVCVQCWVLGGPSTAVARGSHSVSGCVRLSHGPQVFHPVSLGDAVAGYTLFVGRAFLYAWARSVGLDSSSHTQASAAAASFGQCSGHFASLLRVMLRQLACGLSVRFGPSARSLVESIRGRLADTVDSAGKPLPLADECAVAVAVHVFRFVVEEVGVPALSFLGRIVPPNTPRALPNAVASRSLVRTALMGTPPTGVDMIRVEGAWREGLSLPTSFACPRNSSTLWGGAASLRRALASDGMELLHRALMLTPWHCLRFNRGASTRDVAAPLVLLRMHMRWRGSPVTTSGVWSWQSWRACAAPSKGSLIVRMVSLHNRLVRRAAIVATVSALARMGRAGEVSRTSSLSEAPSADNTPLQCGRSCTGLSLVTQGHSLLRARCFSLSSCSLPYDGPYRCTSATYPAITSRIVRSAGTVRRATSQQGGLDALGRLLRANPSGSVRNVGSSGSPVWPVNHVLRNVAAAAAALDTSASLMPTSTLRGAYAIQPTRLPPTCTPPSVKTAPLSVPLLDLPCASQVAVVLLRGSHPRYVCRCAASLGAIRPSGDAWGCAWRQASAGRVAFFAVADVAAAYETLNVASAVSHVGSDNHLVKCDSFAIDSVPVTNARTVQHMLSARTLHEPLLRGASAPTPSLGQVVAWLYQPTPVSSVGSLGGVSWGAAVLALRRVRTAPAFVGTRDSTKPTSHAFQARFASSSVVVGPFIPTPRGSFSVRRDALLSACRTAAAPQGATYVYEDVLGALCQSECEGLRRDRSAIDGVSAVGSQYPLLCRIRGTPTGAASSPLLLRAAIQAWFKNAFVPQLGVYIDAARWATGKPESSRLNKIVAARLGDDIILVTPSRAIALGAGVCLRAFQGRSESRVESDADSPLPCRPLRADKVQCAVPAAAHPLHDLPADAGTKRPRAFPVENDAPAAKFQEVDLLSNNGMADASIRHPSSQRFEALRSAVQRGVWASFVVLPLHLCGCVCGSSEGGKQALGVDGQSSEAVTASLLSLYSARCRRRFPAEAAKPPSLCVTFAGHTLWARAAGGSVGMWVTPAVRWLSGHTSAAIVACGARACCGVFSTLDAPKGAAHLWWPAVCRCASYACGYVPTSLASLGSEGGGCSLLDGCSDCGAAITKRELPEPLGCHAELLASRAESVVVRLLPQAAVCVPLCGVDGVVVNAFVAGVMAAASVLSDACVLSFSAYCHAGRPRPTPSSRGCIRRGMSAVSVAVLDACRSAARKCVISSESCTRAALPRAFTHSVCRVETPEVRRLVVDIVETAIVLGLCVFFVARRARAAKECVSSKSTHAVVQDVEAAAAAVFDVNALCIITQHQATQGLVFASLCTSFLGIGRVASYVARNGSTGPNRVAESLTHAAQRITPAAAWICAALSTRTGFERNVPPSLMHPAIAPRSSPRGTCKDRRR